MPSNRLPQATNKLRPKDQDLSFVQDNLASPVDQLLKFINGLLDGSTSEALQVADLTATGTVSAGSVSAGSVGASGPVTGATATIAGLIAGGSFRATAGLKIALGGWTYSNAAYPGGAFPGQVVTSTGAVTLFWTPPAAGSIIGASCHLIAGVAATTDLQVVVNGVTLVTASAVVAAAATDGYITAPKGTYPFTAGQRIRMGFQWSASPINVTAHGMLWVEMDG